MIGFPVLVALVRDVLGCEPPEEVAQAFLRISTAEDALQHDYRTVNDWLLSAIENTSGQ